MLMASYPSAILCRDKALVCNLEHIKCIISTDYVLVLNANDEAVIYFIQELQRRIAPELVCNLPRSHACIRTRREFSC